MPYVELHCHSCFSFREGASTPLELVIQATLLGYTALALTDHDNLAGAMEFARTSKTWGLKPITGAEITVTVGRTYSGSSPAKNLSKNLEAPREDACHLTLLAETPGGYANLSRLLSRANLASPRGEPLARFDWLADHPEGVIALSGARKGG